MRQVLVRLLLMGSFVGAFLLLMGVVDLSGAMAASGQWTWTNLSPSSSPGPLTGAAGAFDPSLNAMVLFGGQNGTGVSSSTEEWVYGANGYTWQVMSPTSAPPGLYDAAMGYDEATNELILYGGTEGNGTINGTTYAFDGTTWTALSPATSPPPLTGASMVFDTAANQMILFGGETPTSVGQAVYSTYGFDGATWTPLVPWTSGPSFRYGASMAYDPQNQTVVLFGGENTAGYLNDTWIYTPSSGWTEVTAATAPPARAFASLTYDQASGDLILFGGDGASGPLGDMWAWDGSSWTEITTSSDPSAAVLPPARGGAAMTEDSAYADPTVLLYGGTGTSGLLGDMWSATFTPPTIAITTPSLPDAQQGVPYDETLTAANGTNYSWSSNGTLPPGLSLSSAGVISGTPTASGSYSFTVTLSGTVPVVTSTVTQDVYQSVSEPLTIVVLPPPVSVGSTVLPAGQMNIPYATTLQASGGTAPYHWQLVSGSLPTGLSLSTGGALNGIPLENGTFSFTVQVTDSSATPETTTQSYQVTIGYAPVAFSFNGLPGGQVGKPYQENLQATGGDGTYVWSETGTLPPGVTLTQDGTLSGTPTTAGSYTFTLSVADTSNPPLSASSTETITISTAGSLVENYNVTFSTTDQSMWAPGSANSGSITVPLFNVSWNESGSASNIATVGGGCWWIFCIPTTYYGGAINASTSGEIGLSLGLNGTEGSVSVSYPGQFQLTVNPPAQGSDLVTVDTNWVPSPGQASITSVPMSGSISLNGDFGFSASVNGELCIFACANITIIPSFSLGPWSGQIFTISSSDASSVPIISLLSTIADVPGISGDVGFPQPQLGSTTVASDGVTVEAQGTANFLSLHINGAQIALCLATLETGGIGCKIPLTENISFAGVDVGYTILFLGLDAYYNEVQAFQFNPGTPQVTLSLNQAMPYTVVTGTGTTYASGNAASVSFPAGDSVQLTAPWTGLQVTPSFSIPGNQFGNSTSISDQFDYAIRAGSVTATLDGKGINFGPIIDYQINTPQCNNTSLVSLAVSEAESGGLCSDAAPVFTNTWALGGFNTVSESTIAEKIDTIPPTTTVSLSGTDGLAYNASSGDYWFTSPVGVQFTSKDPLDGVATVSYSEDNGSTWQTDTNPVAPPASGAFTFVDTTQVSTPGVYTLLYYGTDTAGNVETVHKITFTYLPDPTVTAVNPGNGPAAGGTFVTITGTNFTLPDGTPVVTAVDFGSVPATTFTTVSATEITAVLPSESAGTVNVTVTTLSGTSAISSADQFTILPLPTVTGVRPENGPKAGGTTVTITGTGFTTATGVFFGQVPAASFTVQSDSTIVAVEPAQAPAKVDITVQTACALDEGQNWPDATSCGTSLTASADQFVVLPLPVVRAVTPPNGPMAGGTTVTITGTGFTTTTAVYFGNLAATSFRVVSDTELQAVSPAAASVKSPTAEDITVTTSCGSDLGQVWPDATSCGTSLTSVNDEFVILPLPTLTAISRHRGMTSGGTWVTITGTGFTTATAVNFGANADTHQGVDYQVLSDSEIAALVPAGSGTVDVTVTTSCADDEGQIWPTATSCLTTPIGSANAFTYVGLLADGSTSPGVMLGGRASVASPNGEVVDDATGRGALVVVGQSHLSATAVGVVGESVVGRDASVTPSPTTLPVPMANPLADLTLEVATTDMAGASFMGRHVTVAGDASRTLEPGVYQGGLTITGDAHVTLDPGVYYVSGGDFVVSGRAVVNGAGAVIVVLPDSEGHGGTAVVAGSASLTLGAGTLANPAQTQEPFENLSLVVFGGATPDRQPPVALGVFGGAELITGGTVYLPGGALGVGGQAKAELGGALVQETYVQGNGNLQLN